MRCMILLKCIKKKQVMPNPHTSPTETQDAVIAQEAKFAAYAKQKQVVVFSLGTESGRCN